MFIFTRLMFKISRNMKIYSSRNEIHSIMNSNVLFQLLIKLSFVFCFFCWVGSHCDLLWSFPPETILSSNFEMKATVNVEIFLIVTDTVRVSSLICDISLSATSESEIHCHHLWAFSFFGLNSIIKFIFWKTVQRFLELLYFY